MGPSHSASILGSPRQQGPAKHCVVVVLRSGHPVVKVNALSGVSKTWKRAPTSRGDVAVSPYFKVEFGKLYNIPHLKNATFSHKYLVLLVILLHLSHFFVSISRKSVTSASRSFQKIFLQEDSIIKNRSYERRHQSDTVCQNIFDSYTYDSTRHPRHPLNITQIDKIMPYHQT